MAVLIIFLVILQTVINLRMLSIGGCGYATHRRADRPHPRVCVESPAWGVLHVGPTEPGSLQAMLREADHSPPEHRPPLNHSSDAATQNTINSLFIHHKRKNIKHRQTDKQNADNKDTKINQAIS